jgi:hypothetical protein
MSNTDTGQNQGSEWRYGIISIQIFMMGNGYFSTYLPVDSFLLFTEPGTTLQILLGLEMRDGLKDWF